MLCSKYEAALTIGERGAVKKAGFGAAASTFAASTVSSAGAGTVVSDTCSPSVVGCSDSTGAGSEFFSSSSDAATSATLAESIAGSVTRLTSTSLLEVMDIVPFLLSQASTWTPTEKPSRNPSAASMRASSPAIVVAILKTASIPSLVTLASINFPIGRVRSCSRSNLIPLPISIELAAKTVGPAEVLPCSPQVTILPEIVRAFESAAVIVIGKLIFIGLNLLPLGFAQHSSRRWR